MTSPVVSVVMAAYNCEKYVKSAVMSILGQSFSDFEFVIVDDCSTDNTGSILEELAASDSRIVLLRNETNLKLASSLNKGIKKAQGKYIARFDSDDISAKDRLLKQVRFMDEHPDCDVCCTRIFTLTDGIIKPETCGRDYSDDALFADFICFNPVIHPTVMIKSDLLKEYKYNTEKTCSEDYDLWVRMLSDNKKISMLNEYLYFYRIHGSSITLSTHDKQLKEVKEPALSFYRKFLFDPSEDDIGFYLNHIYYRDKYDFTKTFDFFRKVKNANKLKKSFNAKDVISTFYEVISECLNKTASGKIEKLMIFKLGGFKLLNIYLNRKKRIKADCEAAKSAAEKYGLKSEGYENNLPIFKFSEDLQP